METQLLFIPLNVLYWAIAYPLLLVIYWILVFLYWIASPLIYLGHFLIQAGLLLIHILAKLEVILLSDADFPSLMYVHSFRHSISFSVSPSLLDSRQALYYTLCQRPAFTYLVLTFSRQAEKGSHMGTPLRHIELPGTKGRSWTEN